RIGWCPRLAVNRRGDDEKRKSDRQAGTWMDHLLPPLEERYRTQESICQERARGPQRLRRSALAASKFQDDVQRVTRIPGNRTSGGRHEDQMSQGLRPAPRVLERQ